MRCRDLRMRRIQVKQTKGFSRCRAYSRLAAWHLRAKARMLLGFLMQALKACSTPNPVLFKIPNRAEERERHSRNKFLRDGLSLPTWCASSGTSPLTIEL